MTASAATLPFLPSGGHFMKAVEPYAATVPESSAAPKEKLRRVRASIVGAAVAALGHDCVGLVLVFL
jgi:hypothetical protein